MKDYYALLGIQKTAGTGEIHKAYWQLASRCHPDKGGSHEAMVQIVEAWRILSDPAKRARYDQLLNYRPAGWRNRKFDDDVQEARKRAETYAPSWTEFEEVYQKAFYTFNQDFYGADFDIKAAGPYSPLMASKANGAFYKGGSRNGPVKNGDQQTWRGKWFDYFFKTIIIITAVVSVIFWYRHHGGFGRYVPLVQETSYLLMLDTTNGAVYRLERQAGVFSSSWTETIPPISGKIIK